MSIIIEFAEFNAAEAEAVRRIVERTAELCTAMDIHYPPVMQRMDLAAIHHHTPLRLRDLAEADGFNFVHDVFGMLRHFDRETGRFADHFVPRFAEEAAS